MITVIIAEKEGDFLHYLDTYQPSDLRNEAAGGNEEFYEINKFGNYV